MDNNGNVVKMHCSSPLNEQISDYVYYEMRYSYDASNRLKTVAEYQGTLAGLGAQSYAQAYDYDRWSNRRINAAGTWSDVPEPQYKLDSLDADKRELTSPSNRLYGR